LGVRKVRAENADIGFSILPLKYKAVEYKGQLPVGTKIVTEQVNTFTYLRCKISYE